MDRDFMHFQAAFIKANDASRESVLSWIKVVISILTPSLVLLIGLQDKNPDMPASVVFFLVVSIIFMSAAILSGLYVLGSEGKGYRLLRDEVGKSWNDKSPFPTDGVMLPNSYKYAQSIFSYSALLSIVSLTVFGVLKYITSTNVR